MVVQAALGPPYLIEVGSGPIVAVALHDGHALRPEVAQAIALDEGGRLREEDPHTGAWTAVAPTRIVVRRSRFEVDLNRPRDRAIYETPDMAWGLDVWDGGLTQSIRDGSLAIYDAFYRDVAGLLTEKIDEFGGVLVYDLHSYNHRRDGSDEQAPQSENPDVNLGTGALGSGDWLGVRSAFLDAMNGAPCGDRRMDARENVRFQGGHFSGWIARRFSGRACPLAIELKKIFMDEWTGELDGAAHADVFQALEASVRPVTEAFRAELEGEMARDEQPGILPGALS